MVCDRIKLNKAAKQLGILSLPIKIQIPPCSTYSLILPRVGIIVAALVRHDELVLFLFLGFFTVVLVPVLEIVGERAALRCDLRSAIHGAVRRPDHKLMVSQHIPGRAADVILPKLALLALVLCERRNLVLRGAAADHHRLAFAAASQRAAPLL